jgi:aspartate-semialdehyde dehydrogenase
MQIGAIMEKIPVAILGATGAVGQRFIQLLDNHPWFQVAALTGSQRSEGKSYGEACTWVIPGDMPTWAIDMPVINNDSPQLNVPLAFSALPAVNAQEVEPMAAKRGITVCSNASSYRRESDVPILLPEVNPDHASLVSIQRQNRGWKGCIVTNPNCTSTGLTVALKALQDALGLSRGFVVSMQAVSGAGYPGVASLDILDNVIPYIEGEEEKVAFEPCKMLGKLEKGQIQPANLTLSVHCNRVAVSDAHMVCLSIEVEKKVSVEEVAHILHSYQAPEISRDLPSTPRPVIILRKEKNRPQPSRDRMAGHGMSTVIGRLRPDSIFDYKMVILSHNTIRGAAGGSIYNAELLVKMGLISS